MAGNRNDERDFVRFRGHNSYPDKSGLRRRDAGRSRVEIQGFKKSCTSCAMKFEGKMSFGSMFPGLKCIFKKMRFVLRSQLQNSKGVV